MVVATLRASGAAIFTDVDNAIIENNGTIDATGPSGIGMGMAIYSDG